MAWHTIGITIFLASWWATEVIPIPATSLMPLILFPAFGIMPMAESAAAYARPTIFLLLGGFIIATALTRWDLHRRIALGILVKVGSKPDALLAGFMAVTALISMWISNTASTLMMIPIALSVAEESAKDDPKSSKAFVLCLLLGIAYSASIGGLGTPIGTPPNLFVVSFMKNTYGIDISFLTWMLLGVPVVLVLVPLAWFVLSRWAFPHNLQQSEAVHTTLVQRYRDLGPLSVPERRVILVFSLIVACWIMRVPYQTVFQSLLWLNDAMIAVGGAVLLFLIPAGDRRNKSASLLDWDSANQIPWGVLLLFGGGLSLAAAVAQSGLALWLGEALAVFAGFPSIILIFGLVSLVIFFTELTSNTATTATLIPVLAAIAATSGLDPMVLFAPLALAASCAFMLPVATAPNAVVYSTGNVSVAQMSRAGFRLNILAIVAVSLLCYGLVPIVFN